MRKSVLGFLGPMLLFFSVTVFSASKNFDGIQCGTDIAKALTGRSMPNETIVILEKKYKNLGLKNLGGSDEDDLFFVSWLICGDEYQLLQKKDVVQDVLKLPHSQATPTFFGECRIDNGSPKTLVAVVNNAGNAENLTVVSAWTIDHKKARFVALAPDGVRCPRSGIVNR